MSNEDILLGKVLGQVELVVSGVATLDIKIDRRVSSLYKENKELQAQISNLKAKVYWIAGILSTALGADMVIF